MMKSKRGGVRENSGRKKLNDKKEPLTVYLRPSKIKAAGGREQARKRIVEYIEKVK